MTRTPVDGLGELGRSATKDLLAELPALLELGRTPIGRQLGLGEIADQFDAAMSDATAELTEVAENLVRDSGAEELIPCIDAGILTLSSAGLAADRVEISYDLEA